MLNGESMIWLRRPYEMVAIYFTASRQFLRYFSLLKIFSVISISYIKGLKHFVTK